MDSIDEIMAAEFAEEEAAQEGNGLDEQAESSGNQVSEAMPHLPDGLGLDYEDVRMMLAKKHETNISKDDPIMMMVTIINAFLGELEKVTNRHNTAVTKIMADQSAKYIAGVKATTDALSKTLAENSVDAIKSIFDTHSDALKASKINARWCAGIIAVSALANVAIMALKAWN